MLTTKHPYEYRMPENSSVSRNYLDAVPHIRSTSLPNPDDMLH